jgi:hypothetical protein
MPGAIRRAFATVVLLTLAAFAAIAEAQSIPAGTVLPVSLSSSLEARHDKAGRSISGKIMQEVRLPDGARIPRGTKIFGHVVQVKTASPGSPSQIAIQFDYLLLKGRRVPIAVNARAIASQLEVYEAKLPTNAIDDYGTSPSDWNTVQIGGAGVYRGNGEVVSGNEIVGRTTDYGAVTGRLISTPNRGCFNGSEREQALWKFSPWSCGTYGLGDLSIVHPTGAPPSDVVLESPRNIHVAGGSGWLLKTIATGR